MKLKFVFARSKNAKSKNLFQKNDLVNFAEKELRALAEKNIYLPIKFFTL